MSARQRVAVSDGLVESFPQENRASAAVCLKSKCLNDVSRCVSSSGPCARAKFVAPARLACSDVAQALHAGTSQMCQAQCEAAVHAKRGDLWSGSKVSKFIQSDAERQHADELAQRRAAPESIGDDAQKRAWRECVNQCQGKRTADAPAYVACREEQLTRLTVECAVDKCKANIRDCAERRCGISTP